jgi:uncharacterized membrane protein SpoIIM required for sporulation/ABC-type transport system involved in multi-copper enzyme maturation permease subunit
MFEKLRPVWVITRREVRDQFRDWRIIFPIAGLTLFFPFLMNFTAQQLLNFVEDYGANIIGERLIPFLLMIVGFFPISVSLVIALESFVGEKERNSIEPLLNTPLENWQVYLGKLISSTVPPLLGSYLGMTVYIVGLIFKGIPIPEFGMMVLIITLTTVQALVMVSGAVVVSTQATSVRAANLLASFIIIPAALLIQGESVVMFWGHTDRMLWWAVFGLSVLGILLVRVGLAHFQREELLGREIDVLNLRWMWKQFSKGFTNGAANPWQWYRQSVFPTLHRMRVSTRIVAIITAAAIVIGLTQVQRFNIPLPIDNLDQIDENLDFLVNSWTALNFQPVLFIFWNNLRVMLVAMILGYLSLGILGMLPLIASMGVVGYLLGLLADNGLPVLDFVWLLIPHGIFEIPAAVLATAALLHAGVLLATPQPDKPVSEILLSSLADWAKVMVGVVIPLLLTASMIEAWFTPRLVLWVLQ